jgi:hypothetical protein
MVQVAEHQETVRDGRSGVESVTISRHLGDKVMWLAQASPVDR